MTNILPVSSVVASEALTSLYPITVKSVNLNLMTQTMTRMMTLAMFSSLFSNISILNSLSPRFAAISALQIFHILVSYKGFQNLSAGTSMTIFYTYPLFNILIDNYKNGNNKHGINKTTIMMILIAMLGVFVISIPNIQESDKSKKVLIIGIIAMLLSALTESMTYHFYKDEKQLNPFDSVLTMYMFGAIALMLFYPFFMEKGINTNKDIKKLFLANLLIGVIGFTLKYYGVPRMKTDIFSVLSFVGVIMAYVFGWYFQGETITKYHIIGTILILFSINQIYGMES